MILSNIREQLKARKTLMLTELAEQVGLSSEQLQLALEPLKSRGRIKIEAPEPTGCGKGCGACASSCAPDLRRVIWLGAA